MIPARLKLYALLALAFVAGALGIYSANLRLKAERQRREIAERRLKAVTTKMEVRDEIEIMDDERLSDRAREWVRSDDDR